EEEEEEEEEDSLEEERRFYTRVGLRCEDLAVVDINAHKIFATVSPDRTLQSMKEHEMFYVYQLERDVYGEAAAAATTAATAAAAAAAAAAGKPAAPAATEGDGNNGAQRVGSATAAASVAAAARTGVAEGGGQQKSAAARGKAAAAGAAAGAAAAATAQPPPPQPVKQIRTPVRLFAVLHRRLEISRSYLASPYRLEVFGTPLVCRVVPMTGRQLYDKLYRRFHRFLRLKA
ncbi:unnamed protein product, partial [Hapterophycus canaliculatus]